VHRPIRFARIVFTALVEYSCPPFRKQTEDLPGVGEAVFLVLREDQFAVRKDIELAAPPGDDEGVNAALLLDLGRETRGPGLIVSHHTIADLDSHGDLLLTKVKYSAPAGRRQSPVPWPGG
jgi:hypothetical protein